VNTQRELDSLGNAEVGSVSPPQGPPVDPLRRCGAGLTAVLDTPAEAHITDAWDKTFPKSTKIDHRKVALNNRYGITLWPICTCRRIAGLRSCRRSPSGGHSARSRNSHLACMRR
jgi:hypothetical protein